MIAKMKQKGHELLRKSEKYTKTDMVYLTKGGGWLMFGQFTSSIFAFILTYVFANFLTAEIYGNYKYVIATVGFLATFSLTGINTSVSQSISNHYYTSYKAGFKYSIIYSLPFLILCLGGSIYYIVNDNYFLGISLLLVSFMEPIVSSSSLYQSGLEGLRKFKTLSNFQLIKSFIVSIVLIFFALESKNPLILIFAYYFTDLIVSFFFYRRVKAILNEKSGKNIDDEQMIPYAKHLSVSNLISNTAFHIDKILIFQTLGATQLATYSFALIIPDQIKTYVSKIGTLALPKFSQHLQKNVGTVVRRKVLVLSFFLSIITILYIVCVPFVFKIFLPQYTDSILLAQIFGISILASTVIQKTVIDGTKQIKNNYLFKTFSGLVRILLIAVGLYFGQLIGVIIARVLSRFFDFFFSIYLIEH